jgi:hypothetical protein
MTYIVIETDAGLTVAEMQPESSPEETATVNKGVLVDEGPYSSFDDAYDALLALSRQLRLDGE